MRQCKRTEAAPLHGAVVGVVVEANVGAERFECSVRTDCSFLLLHASFACQRVFCIRSKASFSMHFTNVPRAA